MLHVLLKENLYAVLEIVQERAYVLNTALLRHKDAQGQILILHIEIILTIRLIT